MTNSTSTITFTGSLEDLSRFQYFGFIVSDDGSHKAFMGLDVFNACGFVSQNLTDVSVLVVEAEPGAKGLRVTRVVSVDGVDGHEPAQKPAKVKRTVTRSSKKRTLNKRPQQQEPQPAPQATLASFINAKQVDCNVFEVDNREVKVRLFKICTKRDEHVRYAIFDQEDVLVRSLESGLNRDQALLEIGKSYSPPQTEGKKTNDPTLSRQMQQPKASCGGGKKVA